MKRAERIRRMHDRGLTYEQISEVEGVSRQRVAQILKPYKIKPQVPILLTAAGAAAYLGIHMNTLRRWTNEGTLECIRLGNKRGDRRFTRQELDKFLKGEG